MRVKLIFSGKWNREGFFFLKYEIVYECKICKGSQTLILFSIRKSLRLIKVHFYRFYSR